MELRDRPVDMEITSAMVEAGVYAVREYCLGLPLSDLVLAVYVAMRTEELNTAVTAHRIVILVLEPA